MKTMRQLVLEDAHEDKQYDPDLWGMEDTDTCRLALRAFLELHADDFVMMPDGKQEPWVEYVMFVDDMEGFGVRDELEAGRVRVADALAREIIEKYPSTEYDPFGADMSLVRSHSLRSMN